MDRRKARVTAFQGMSKRFEGPLLDVALAMGNQGGGNLDGWQVFDVSTGRVVDLDLRGDALDIERRLSGYAVNDTNEPKAESRGRGRPKLGVVAREVTLLPRHWDWLAAQQGGASQVLRRLIDEARQRDGGKVEEKAAQERAYRFMSEVAGDFPRFEAASRALFAADRAGLDRETGGWPGDIRAYLFKLLAQAPSTTEKPSN